MREGLGKIKNPVFNFRQNLLFLPVPGLPVLPPRNPLLDQRLELADQLAQVLGGKGEVQVTDAAGKGFRAAAGVALLETDTVKVPVGGFAMLALSVSAQVTLGHRGYRSVMLGKPWQVAAIGALMCAAMVSRVTMEFDRAHYFAWMGVASGAFLAATLVWTTFILPKMRFEAQA